MKRLNFLLACLLILSGSIHNLYAQEEWNSSPSAHFTVYFKPGSYDFALKVKEKAEKYYLEIISDLGFAEVEPLLRQQFLAEKEIKIYIYPDQEEYVRQTNQPQWSFGCANYKERSISGFRLANQFLFQVLPHELGHIAFREFSGFNPNIPSWLDEGAACFVEPKRRSVNKRTVREALRDKTFMNLEELTSIKIHEQKDQKVVDLFYAESVSVVDFLIEKFGKRKFALFCRSLKEWATFEEALRKHYPFQTLGELNQAWLDSLK